MVYDFVGSGQEIDRVRYNEVDWWCSVWRMCSSTYLGLVLRRIWKIESTTYSWIKCREVSGVLCVTMPILKR